MKIRWIWLSILSLGVAPYVSAQQPDPVKTEKGLVQSVFEDGFTVYRGIPFAAPLVGDLRWRAPQASLVPNADSLKVLDACFAWRRTPEGEAWAK